MSLEIKHNRAEHTHENEQFRRIGKTLKLLFENQKWSGLLIGNPFHENYFRFRPDGILLYNHGVIIIDLKAYSGSVKLPPNKTEFESMVWYTESDTDKKRTLIKAGNRFINPFKQLDSYRNAFKEIVANELNLNGAINQNRTCALNIFSGPLTIQNSVPKEIPYYKITQESDLGTMLYDYSSENIYSSELASALCSIFNAEEWHEHIEMPETDSKHKRGIEIGADVEQFISEFLKSKESGVLVLESMDTNDRDNWVEYILSQSQEFQIPQIESWIHSARVSRKVSKRLGIELQSLYNTIYGGTPKSLNIEEAVETEEKQFEEQLQEVIPIRSDDSIDESAVIILHEAHLVSRSLHQSELLRFGSGRLLEDLLIFLNLTKTRRKLICIGDPYSLTYGKDTDSAINLDAIAEHFEGEISHYRQPLRSNEFNGKLSLRLGLAGGIEQKMFNNLDFPWQSEDLEQISKDLIPTYLSSWYSKPLDSEPSNTVMVYSNKDARKINLWVKTHALKNGKDLAQNDLLLINNNINIPDETGFGQPTKLYNGMFLLVDSVGQTISKPIALRQSKKPIILSFTKIEVTCISLPNRLKTEVFLLDNYFRSESGLSKEEQIAFRVFVNELVGEKEKEHPFEKSPEYMQMQQDKAYKDGLDNEAIRKKQYESGEKVKTKLDAQQREIRKIKRSYKRNFRNRLLSNITKADPVVNAIHAHYGWALTVHKCIGSSFSKAILKAYQGENRGISNSDYYRWLFSGVTTTTNTLMVANPQSIHPLMETQFEDTSAVIHASEPSKKKILSFPNYDVEEKFRNKIPSHLKSNVIGATCELSKSLERHGFLLESISPNGDYLTKVHYSIPSNTEKHLVIAINNKGQKDDWSVSSIRIEQSTDVNTDTVNQEIDKLFISQPILENGLDVELPDDFRLSVYQRWKDQLLDVGYTFMLVESHNNQDIFSIVNKNSVSAKIRVWYRNDGFFSKIVILEKSDNEISDNLNKWLLNAN
jgi:hypothetical protein